MKELTDRMNYAFHAVKCKIILYIFFSIIIFAPFFLSAQENEISPGILEESIDALFDKPAGKAVSDQTDESEEAVFEENIDDLFNNPEEDIIAEDSEEDHLTQFEESDKVLLNGHYYARGGGGIGWNKTPDPSDLSDGLVPVFGAESEASLSFDARPDPTFRFYGKIYTEIDPDGSSEGWTDPEFEELFSDYNWLDKAYFRMGKHQVKWGQGRIFTPGDLVEESEDGVTIRVTLPTVLDGVSFVSFYDDSFIEEDEAIGSEDLAYGMIADKTFGNVNLSVGGRFRKSEKLRTLNSFKTVLFGTDLFSDVVTHFDQNEKPLFEVLAGFFREWPDFKFYGEYCFDGSSENYDDHSIGLAAGYKNIFSTSLDFAIEWQHAFIDDSGSILPVLRWAPWKNVKASIGVPVIYGSDDSRYVDDNDSPVDSRIAGVFFLELSSSF